MKIDLGGEGSLTVAEAAITEMQFCINSTKKDNNYERILRGGNFKRGMC